MKVAGHDRKPDWDKLGPSILIATALIVAIRTAKWAAKGALCRVERVTGPYMEAIL
jgi:hypothetical protein